MPRILVAFTLLLCSCHAPVEPLPDYGTCYSPRPICITGGVVCMCDTTSYCFWACR